MYACIAAWLVLAACGLAGCGARSGAMDATRTHAAQSRSAMPPAQRVEAQLAVQPPAVAAMPAMGPRRETRTIDKDSDADGIADYRVVITEEYDAAGMLVRRTKETDFEADGIVDARYVTTFE